LIRLESGIKSWTTAEEVFPFLNFREEKEYSFWLTWLSIFNCARNVPTIQVCNNNMHISGVPRIFVMGGGGLRLIYRFCADENKDTPYWHDSAWTWCVLFPSPQYPRIVARKFENRSRFVPKQSHSANNFFLVLAPNRSL